MTAPALPGAAPDPAPGRNDPARLPPEVERALSLFRAAVEVYGAEDGGFRRIDPREAALRTAIARALGGDGEPVAWRVVAADGTPAGRPHLTQREAEFMAKTLNEDPDKYAPYRAEALYTRPAATGAEVERAVAEEREAIAAWHDAEADRIRQEIATSLQIMRENASAFVGLNTSMDHEYAQAETHRECAAAIRARGVKS